MRLGGGDEESRSSSSSSSALLLGVVSLVGGLAEQWAKALKPLLAPPDIHFIASDALNPIQCNAIQIHKRRDRVQHLAASKGGAVRCSASSSSLPPRGACVPVCLCVHRTGLDSLAAFIDLLAWCA